MASRHSDPRSRLNSGGREPISAAGEAHVRQLIASGDDKAALELAKDLHKLSGSSTSEALLVDAYAERIRTLLRRNLTIEAQSLLDMVRQRYPTSRARLAELTPRVEAKPLPLDDLVRPLNDPDLAAESRTAIDRRLQREVWDLKALASCEALRPDHELRKAAAVLRAGVAGGHHWNGDRRRARAARGIAPQSPGPLEAAGKGDRELLSPRR